MTFDYLLNRWKNMYQTFRQNQQDTGTKTRIVPLK